MKVTVSVYRFYYTVEIFILLFQLFLENQCHVYKLPLKMCSKLLSESVLEQRFMQANNLDINLQGSPGQGYYIEMAIGTPPQMINALVDTGSSNFAIAASPHEDIDKYFHVLMSETLINLGYEVSVPYTQGMWKGFLGMDIVRISALENSSGIISFVAFITESEQFFINGSHWEAILGLAYKDIARPSANTEPFFDSLTKQMNISNIFSIHLCGLNENELAGSLILGGVDHSLHSGALEYIPIYKEWYYEVIIAEIFVGETSLEMDCKEYNYDKTIVDSGTTNLRLPTRVFNRIVDQLIEKVQDVMFIPRTFWESHELLCWKNNKVPWESFPNLTLTFAALNNTSLDLVISPCNYLRQIKTDVSQFSPDSVCYKFSIAPSDLGTVVGAVVMEGFYIVFDREASKLGFAKTACPDVCRNGFSSFVRGPYHSKENGFDCAYIKPKIRSSMLLVATIAMGFVCLLCFIFLMLLVIRFQVLRFCIGESEHDEFNLLSQAKK